jgi:iron complex outermembrane receptor protein
VQGARLSARTRRGRAVSAVGASFQHERIDSNALDDHDREQAQAWLVHRRPLGERTAIEAGLAAVDFSDYSRYLLPSLAVRHAVARSWTAFASLARTAREPSYTERFLQTSANVGNPSLAPERSTYAEAGLRWRAGSYALDLALFERRTDDLVDWARPPGEVTWQADNFDGHRSRGAEIEWRWRPDAGAIEHVDLAVTALDTELDARGLEIKYALDYPERSLKGGAVWRIGERFRLTTRARYQDRSSGESAVLVDARASWRVSRAELFVEGTNLLDETVVEAGFAPLPGRWIYAGLRLDY